MQKVHTNQISNAVVAQLERINPKANYQSRGDGVAILLPTLGEKTDGGNACRGNTEERQQDTLEASGSNPAHRTKLYGQKPLAPFPGQRKAFYVEWAKPLGLPECPYLYRWVFATPWFAIRIHHWISSDDSRAFHDHPWWFLTFVLAGGYTDVSPEGEQKMRRFSLRFRRASHRHTVRVNKGGCWTLLITGPERRWWGFWVKEKFLKAARYFRRHGHHPCE